MFSITIWCERPMPRLKRPPLAACTVSACWAIVTGWREYVGTTPVIASVCSGFASVQYGGGCAGLNVTTVDAFRLTNLPAVTWSLIVAWPAFGPVVEVPFSVEVPTAVVPLNHLMVSLRFIFWPV